MTNDTIRLGLIGDNIAASHSPLLHTIAGRLCGFEVTYELLVPTQRNKTVEELIAFCSAEGFQGLNITYPYKERVVGILDAADPAIRKIAACNTVVFRNGIASGFNTDFTGFIRGFRATFQKDTSPGKVAMIGAGGVGKAIAFGWYCQVVCLWLRIDTAAFSSRHFRRVVGPQAECIGPCMTV